MKLKHNTMKEAVKYSTIAIGLLVETILAFYYFSDILISPLSFDLLIIAGYLFILFMFFLTILRYKC